MTTDTSPKYTKLPESPLVCPKCYEGKYIVTHEDGWQCWNCMKIIYKNAPIIDLDPNDSN